MRVRLRRFTQHVISGFASVPAAKVALTPGAQRISHTRCLKVTMMCMLLFPGQEALYPEELLEIAQAAEPSAGGDATLIVPCFMPSP